MYMYTRAMASTTSGISLHSRHSWRSREMLPTLSCLKTFAVCYLSLEVELIEVTINDDEGVSTRFFV